MSMDSVWDDGGRWIEEDSTMTGFDPEALLLRGFLPPPPRPPEFLDPPPSDGLTTCDLCAWATQQSSQLDGLSFMSWSVTLVIVSVFSAIIGAVVMVSLRRCLKKLNENNVAGSFNGSNGGDKGRGRSGSESQGGEGCCWLMRQNGTRNASFRAADIVTAANHYTLEETYSEEQQSPTVVEPKEPKIAKIEDRQKHIGGGEALYAELDKPVYQNTGYVLEPDTSSPPSSAYYSDLSDRTYETVGNTWEMHRYRGHHHPPHNISTDYV